MASFGTQLSILLLLVLVLSPKIQAREGKFSSPFTHFRTTYNVKDPRVFLKKAIARAPAQAPAPATTATTTTQPEPVFVDRGDSYGLYGSGSGQFSPTKETLTTFENELLNEESTGQSYKTGYPKTSWHSNYNSNPSNNNNNNNQEYRSNYRSNDYTKNYVDSYSYNQNEKYSNNYNGNGYNNNHYGNGYERKREGLSDTRFVENGKHFYDVKDENGQNYDLNGYESGKGSSENEGYYGKNRYQNEFDTMEEYEKQQESLGYTP